MTVWDLVTVALNALRALDAGEPAEDEHLAPQAVSGLRSSLLQLQGEGTVMHWPPPHTSSPRIGPSDQGVVITVDFDAGDSRLRLAAFADSPEHLSDCLVTRLDEAEAASSRASG